MELDDVLKPYINNFRRVFFSKTKHGVERLSVVKLVLVGAYLIANLFAFLQFSSVSTPVLLMKSQSVAPGAESVLNYQIPMTIYGKIAHYLNFLVLCGALFFIISQDKPRSVLKQQLWEFASQSRIYLIGLIFGVGLISVLTLAGLWSYGLSFFVMYVSYEMGTGMNYLWWVLQPVLFLGGSLLLVDTYMQVDESFKARFGNLSKPTKKTASLILVDLLIVVIFFVIAATVFQVTIATGENPGIITRVAGIGWYQITIFWLLLHFLLLVMFTVFNMLVLFVVFVIKRSRAITILILCSLLVGLILFVLKVRQSLPATLDDTQERFINRIVILVSFMGFFLFVIFIFVVYRMKNIHEYINSRASLIPWILLAGMVLIVLKVAPGI